MQTGTQEMFRLAVISDGGVHWNLRRNCSVSPKQLSAMFVALSVSSLVIAGVFWSQGATLVMPFALLEVAALGFAFVMHARHASDAERISLINGALVIEMESGGRASRVEFSRFWVRVGSVGRPFGLVEVVGSGQCIFVGRHLRPDMRPQLAREIRLALHGA